MEESNAVGLSYAKRFDGREDSTSSSEPDYNHKEELERRLNLANTKRQEIMIT